MSAALERFYKGDSAVADRELHVFRSCNEKVGKILGWSNKNEDSINELRQLSLSQGGLFNGAYEFRDSRDKLTDLWRLTCYFALFCATGSFRQRAWPALLEVEPSTASYQSVNGEDLDIIRKDVQRSALFRSQAVAGSIAKGEEQSEMLQHKLVSILSAALSTPLGECQETPCYYQGLHEIAFILLFNLNYDERKTTSVLRKLLQTHLQDATKKDFSNVTFVLESVLMPLLHTLDPEVYQALVEWDVHPTSTILPWLITLLAHPVKDAAVASRLMDAFIANPHPMLPFYVSVALLTHPVLRQQILAAAYDPVMIHMAIQGLPGQLRNDLSSPLSAQDVFVTAQDIIDSALATM
jgi:Rab-GTPase-TBC domain